MSETPRLRSAFPATPRTDARSRTPQASSAGFSSSTATPSKPSPAIKAVRTTAPVQRRNDGPLVPLNVIDAPTQRFYVTAFYAGLLAWRLYNALNVKDELDSTWLFLKWLGIDAAFFVALPAFKIPWLEWSFATTLTIWMLHAIADAFLMYKIPIPILGWLGAMAKVAYDRELAISEHRVKSADILHNSSVILGKQIIQILPEGSAILNPEKRSFCLDASTTFVELPIQINQTTPISIELTRFSIDTDETETMTISGRQAKRLKSEADKGHARSDTNTPRVLQHQVSKTGLYRLTRVIDESKLEVRKRSYDVAVVACPRASLSIDASNKCTGDLSGISLHVAGVPPFTVKYSKRINQRPLSSISQSVQPSELEQHATADGTSDVVMDPKAPQKGWTQSRSVSIEINESLSETGTWSYHVEEVEDGLGNKVVSDTEKMKKAGSLNHAQTLTVHRRPIAFLSSCNSQNPMAAAEGDTIDLPVQIKSHAQIPPQDWPLSLQYTFRPEIEGVWGPPQEERHTMTDARSIPQITRAGKYSLDTIYSQFCQGEIKEPSSCSLYNPPRPDLTMDHEVIFDKCAGNPMGMVVSLDFTGTPPFHVHYRAIHKGSAQSLFKKFDGMRGQIELFPDSAGEYVYQIFDIKDRIYEQVSLKDRNLLLSQRIKPSASADFQGDSKSVKACLGQPVSMPVRFQGEGPWTLDYELVHGTKRKKLNVRSEQDSLDLEIPQQSEGGRYSLILTGVKDKSGCRYPLTSERHVEVRAEQSLAAFGDVGGRRTIETLDDKEAKIPLRLQGIAPWTVRIQNVDTGAPPREYRLKDSNAVITASEAGTYELISVRDDCPGTVDPKANKFSVTWIQRPQLTISDKSATMSSQNVYRKSAVCQGYEDGLSLSLTGSPPYMIQYRQTSESSDRHSSIKPLTVGSSDAQIKMDTTKAGQYTYTFTKLEDDRYPHDTKRFSPLIVKQEVYALPTARFTNSGRTYGYCKDVSSGSGETESEKIPITLTGTPPFTLEVTISHHSGSQRPEIKRISDIHSRTYEWHLSRSSFDVGSHILQIRSVKDSHGCESTIDTDASSVRIQVSSPPTINALESSTDYCVGDRVSFSLSGQAPFDVYYTFKGSEKKASVSGHEFKRIADSPGNFVITGVSDAAMGGGGKCRARKDIQKTIHPYPSVRIERGETKISDIHEGGEVDIHFEFTGTPPFEFTYTRSENLAPRSKLNFKNKKPPVLETRHDVSNEYSKTIRASEEGTYEVVAIKDRYCAYSEATGASRGTGAKVLGWNKAEKLLKD